MASTSEIRRHIAAVQQTQKITRAMYLISSAKMRRAKRELDGTRPYFDALSREIKRVFRVDSDVESRYFYPAGERGERRGRCGCLVITADKGLAGAYNHNVLKRTQELMTVYPELELYVVGEYGRHWFSRRRIPIAQRFLYTAQNPTMYRAREIADVLLRRFESGGVDEIRIIYTDLKNGMNETVCQTRLLPLHRKSFGTPSEEKTAEQAFTFEPSLTAVLESVIRDYIAGYIYSALVDSFCSEQSARMAAMDAANKNAEELLSKLSRDYNRARQDAITQEITEISAGARARRINEAREAGQR